MDPANGKAWKVLDVSGDQNSTQRSMCAVLPRLRGAHMETLTQFSEANEKAASAITRTGRALGSMGPAGGRWTDSGRSLVPGAEPKRRAHTQTLGSRVREHLTRPPMRKKENGQGQR